MGMKPVSLAPIGDNGRCAWHGGDGAAGAYSGAFGIPDWNVAMAGTLIIMLPPLLVVMLMQRWFVRGLIATEK
jgi:hypothetical protein